MIVQTDTISDLEKIITRNDFEGTDSAIFRERLLGKTQGRSWLLGAEVMVLALESLAPENPGVELIAGHHGGAILPFFEYFTKSSLFADYVHVPHEQLAGHMAEGINAAGKTGVAVATSGPGATNLVTAFYDGRMCSRGVVFITGNVATTVAGSEAFQEAPITEMLRPVAKKVYYVTDPAEIPKIMYEAFVTAQSGRPGPVLIDVPKNIQLAKVPVSGLQYSTFSPQQSNYDLEEIVTKFHVLMERILTSEQPLLYIGGGAKPAWLELREFVYKTGIPVVTTLKGKGIFPETAHVESNEVLQLPPEVLNVLSLGMMGMHGTAFANYATDRADLLINIGARFDDRVTGNFREFAKGAYIVQINVDPKGIGPQNIENPRRPHLEIALDSRKALQIMNLLINRRLNLNRWHDEIRELKEQYPLDYDGREHLIRSARPSNENGYIKPQYVIEKIFELTRGLHAIVADVGQHQMWTAQFYKSNDSLSLDTTGGAGTMGYSLPAALGLYRILRKLGNPKEVSVIVGDESFMQTPHTLELYRRLQPNIKIFVIDNKEFDGTPGGMVRQWYDRVHKNTRLPVDGESDIVSIANGFGIPGHAVNRYQEVEPSIKKALSVRGPYLVRFRVDPREDCLPMIPGGTTVKDMVLYQKPK